MTGPFVAITLMSAAVTSCATAEVARPLTVEALDRAKVACAAPDAEMRTDEFHVSIVLNGYTPDRSRQVSCLFDQLQGYAFDQIVASRAPDDPGS